MESINSDAILEIFKDCFSQQGPAIVDVAVNGPRRDCRGDFLDKITGSCVRFLEGDTQQEHSSFFDVPYNELKFSTLGRNFKAAVDVNGNRCIDLCNMFLDALNKLPNEITKNASIATADLFLAINPIVLYYVVLNNVPYVERKAKKNQSAAQIILNRIIDKMAQTNFNKIKHEAIKVACRVYPLMIRSLIESVELKRAESEDQFSWKNLDKFWNRQDFSHITSIHQIRENDKLYYYETESPIVFSYPTLHYNTPLGVRKFKVRVGTCENESYIFDLLEIEEYDADLINKTWIDRIKYFKDELGLTENKCENYKIIEPQPISIGSLNNKVENQIPKHFVVNSIGFGIFKSYYYAGRSKRQLEQPEIPRHGKEAKSSTGGTTEDNSNKIRF